MSTYLTLVPRAERYAQARHNSSPSPYVPPPTRFGNAARPSSEGHKPKLLDHVRHILRFRHYSYQTEKTYVHWITRFIFFHHKRHPREIARKK